MNKLKLVGCLSLFTIAFSSFLVHSNEENSISEIRKDPRVSTQYIPMQKTKVGDSDSYTFLDRTSIKLHPYNQRIRTFVTLTNYNPSLMQDKGDEQVNYQSTLITHYVNCDKKELVKGQIQTFAQPFAEGQLHSNDNNPRRWEAIKQNNQQYNLVIVACSLPLAN